MLTGLAALAVVCAPNIHLTTLSAVVQHESSANQYAIGVNTEGHLLPTQPETLDQAVDAARSLQAAGIDFDAGLGQINVGNWDWLGLDAETVFDPCRNLAAAQTVLSECYARALKTHQAAQQALRAALSCYNTGNFGDGFRNGYVRSVLAAAGIQVPALQADDVQPKDTQAPAPVPAGTPDGFSSPTPDGFSRPAPDQPSASQQGDPYA